MRWAFLLFFVSLIPLFGFFHPGLPVTHDGQDHVARIANFYRNLEEGSIIPRWAANLNWGYGHPILMFLYPLPSYIASLFHFMGFSLVDSTKIVFGLAYVLSGLTMYLWVREFLGIRAGFIAGILYLYAPYRFVDLYVRGAMGEHVAFIFPPLVLYFLLKLSKQPSQKYIAGAVLSFGGLILAHNAISLMFMPIILLYVCYLLWQTRQRMRLLGMFGLLGLLGFGLAAFFWVPAFFEGKYTLRDIVASEEYKSRFVSFGSFLFGAWSYGGSGQFSTQVGIVQWIILLASLFSTRRLYQKKNKLWIFSVGILTTFFITLFLMTDVSNAIWQAVTTLQKFQFPWRFLSVSVFAAAVLGGLVFTQIPRRFQLLASGFLLLALLWFNKDFWHAKDYLLVDERVFTGIYKSTTDTGESSPRWSVRFMEKEPSARIEVISGEASLEETERISTRHVYEIQVQKLSRIRENTLYFPGWEIFVDEEKVPVEFQDPQHRGLMTFFVDSGNHSIIVVFEETRLRRLANIVSGTSFVLLAVLFVWNRKQKRSKRS